MRPPRLYRLLLYFVRLLERAFFREVEVTGARHVPTDRGAVVVAWHPNGLVDPALILTSMPRQVIFGARHGLFTVPLLGAVLRGLGTVPIYRAADFKEQDVKERRDANAKSLDALAEGIAAGALSALFPEGVSHDEPHLLEVKTGAARLYYRARELQAPGAKPPVIVPVGLHYDKKRLFRSRALVRVHPPLALSAEFDRRPEPGEDAEDARRRARGLTALIETTLHEVAHATEDWEIHRILHRARKLIRAEANLRAGADPGMPGVGEVVEGFARVRAGYYRWLKEDPAAVAALRARVERYDADLRALGLEDHHLDRSPRLVSPWMGVLLLLQAAFVFLLLPPLLLLGSLVNGPAALLVWTLTRLHAALRKDVASLKIMFGALVFPLAWGAAGYLGFRLAVQLHDAYPALPSRPVWTGVTVALISLLGALASVRYAFQVRETARAIRVRLTRARRGHSLGRLRAERAKLHDALLALA